MRRVFRTDGPAATVELGRKIGARLTAGDVVALIGDLGTGKTCLTEGIARGLGVPESFPVTSPTFTLVNEYPGRLTLYHLDLYRLGGVADLEEMDYEEYIYGEGVAVIEWAEKILAVLPRDTVFILLEYIDESIRDLTFQGSGERARKVISAIGNGGC
ncbi:MAG TPA: tRNA (adenosine(37)-N6)-threonylcarbamoyltransferase complex ATPase subunit type 1 TsaE [Syntrophales bacterium]|nr:tRNA (adenosine(37)-N6)-threonylcarbamoyltransferase complex ATPase subunit type 1 TsaE [Syntrophales bacterium]HOM06654.1 tRNA (adenosine(37)-N6)-threonylcarbamoyltransferase complex ATPase subunit type 1 TsaE [Syntrophales bacterium]HON99804.1 tRNA (adenosine(37)-N6)-threonylcarbamoyltransferase complex ATPase subunit type 1 TsaE [Syntrophales bacterium]HPC01158.1 tRNA (adenosine(37)-N6)-threonylcarbamoyltransferase complex ATPase subunit type 1 TsaE [Syntrophales bacterium]HPQ06315.1 tRNA